MVIKMILLIIDNIVFIWYAFTNTVFKTTIIILMNIWKCENTVANKVNKDVKILRNNDE